jgi:S1-C subfamily serine protease
LAADWVVVAKAVKGSIVDIASEGGKCTGFVSDDKQDFVVTAAHCDGKEIFADSMPAKVKLKDLKNDLMVLYVEGVDRPALRLAKHDPEVGAQVASYGWGYALNQPLFRATHVSAQDMTVPGFEAARYFAVDTAFVGGQSGGPVVNEAGEVVMIVQLGNDVAGWGVGAELIEEKLGRYFALK